MRLILIGFSILVLLVVGALVGPSFVDWNKYKDQIVTQVANATGLKMMIEGDLSLSILPYPGVKIEDLTVVAPQKIKFENLVTLKSAEVSVALLPLLQKEIKISSVTLIEPMIQIEILANGTPSWETQKLSQARNVKEATPEAVKAGVSNASSQALESIALDKLSIKKGRVAFVNHQNDTNYSAEDINIDLSADSLKGPFNLDGDLVYGGKKIALDVETGRLPAANESLTIKANLGLPEADSYLSFNGVSAISAPFDVQGQAKFNVQKPMALARLMEANFQGTESISLDGLLSANENKIQYDNFKISLGDFVGDGHLKIENLKSQNPLGLNLSLKSNGTLNLDRWIPKKSMRVAKDESAQETVETAKSNDFVPQTLTLPMNINADVTMDVAKIIYQEQIIKGVFLDLDKTGNTTKVSVKALDLPGQSKIDANVTAAYASSSKSQKTGEVTYSDPDVTYALNGQVGSLSEFMTAFAPDVDARKITKSYKTAQVNLNGKVSGAVIRIKDSIMKLDQTVIGLGGRYDASNPSRTKAFIEVSAGNIDFDQILGTSKPLNKETATQNTAAPKMNAEESLKPLQDFPLPLDLGFDVSVQKARINNADVNGVRVTGDLAGKRLNIKNASINNFAGATMNVKGQVANLSDLTGLDLSFYTKTADVERLASVMKVDTSGLPRALKALEASVTAKGTIQSLGFDGNIKAMSGQLDVKGNATDLLGTPSYNNLAIGLSHPNLVKAIQIIAPNFKSQSGLAQPINFRSNATIEDKKIDLSNMAVKLGRTDFDGNLKIDASGKITSVRGTIQAGEIALDDLLGVKKNASSSNAASSSAASVSSGRWSKDTIDLGFMNTLDVDVALSAGSIKYGTWNFTKPATALRIGNGQMSVSDMKAGVFGGQATLSTTVKASPVRVDIKTNMNAIDLDKLARALSGSDKLRSSGNVSFDLSANAVGNSAHALVNALNGQATLEGQDVTLIGFDLAKLARGLATEEKLAVSAMSLVDGALSGGKTKFDTVKGDYKITNGVVNISSMIMDSAEAKIESKGSADLPKWFINVDNIITLKNVSDLDPFEVKIKGPLDKPGNTFGKNILEDYIQDKVRRKIGKELPGILGDDASNLLQGLGIIPKQEQAPAPANDNVTPTKSQPVAPTQEEAPKTIEKPEDAVRELLKGGDPEEALGNLLKGLF